MDGTSGRAVSEPGGGATAGGTTAGGTTAGGATATADRGAIPELRWTARATTVDGIERELSRIWAQPDLTVQGEGRAERRVAARSSVLNLVVAAPRPETGIRAAATVAALTGRHPSRTLIVTAMDPDGPAWLDARIEAICLLPDEARPEHCSELIHLAVGGDTSRHLAACVGPLLIHDLPVAIWWPGDPPFGSAQAEMMLALADRLIVDGSAWSGDGLGRLAGLARIAAAGTPTVFDFALVRQSRWREAIAAVFDRTELRPYVRSIRSIEVSYASHAHATGPADTANLVKPVYHVAWLASRLGMAVESPLMPAGPVRTATMRSAGRLVAVTLGPTHSDLPLGTTVRVALVARRRSRELRVEVTAEAEGVRVRAREAAADSGGAASEGPALEATETSFDRFFRAPRATDVDLLMEAIETGGHDPVTDGAIRLAGALIGEPGS